MKNIVSISTSTHTNSSSARIGLVSGNPRHAPFQRDSLVPVRRAFPAQALVIIRLRSLTPADAGFFLAPRRLIWLAPRRAHRLAPG